jgi:16S rRNA (adenine1518-N6/adenine1519-N6)-dimethyltransferase
VALVAAGVSPQARGESLTVEEFTRIAENKAGAEEVQRKEPSK